MVPPGSTYLPMGALFTGASPELQSRLSWGEVSVAPDQFPVLRYHTIGRALLEHSDTLEHLEIHDSSMGHYHDRYAHLGFPGAIQSIRGLRLIKSLDIEWRVFDDPLANPDPDRSLFEVLIEDLPENLESLTLHGLDAHDWRYYRDRKGYMEEHAENFSLQLPRLSEIVFELTGGVGRDGLQRLGKIQEQFQAYGIEFHLEYTYTEPPTWCGYPEGGPRTVFVSSRQGHTHEKFPTLKREVPLKLQD